MEDKSTSALLQPPSCRWSARLCLICSASALVSLPNRLTYNSRTSFHFVPAARKSITYWSFSNFEPPGLLLEEPTCSISGSLGLETCRSCPESGNMVWPNSPWVWAVCWKQYGVCYKYKYDGSMTFFSLDVTYGWLQMIIMNVIFHCEAKNENVIISAWPWTLNKYSGHKYKVRQPCRIWYLKVGAGRHWDAWFSWREYDVSTWCF
jgi:hypothetical protein